MYLFNPGMCLVPGTWLLNGGKIGGPHGTLVQDCRLRQFRLCVHFIRGVWYILLGNEHN